ncbi:MAG: tRNA (adenosine(37)-N6)-threonylcarbamoyltransferase complex ATPase subunit type 1 TsaE [Candidatus Kerfeldbacteria bacterium]|nr:tRNA (adenosine(37)-N6)-threonylcarbamoyltransferase complex ATPase subunit type 1 TsaE [Candidatus Kerfeldbacteria bacterium]
MPTYLTKTAEQTEDLGKKLSHLIKGGEVLALSGDLGSGKTTFVKGLAKGLGIKHPITSPTFVLMKIYPVTKHQTIKQLVHVDCYRLPAGRHGVPGIELSKIGLDDYLNKFDSVVVIEWAEKIKKLPLFTKRVNFKHAKNNFQRIIKL